MQQSREPPLTPGSDHRGRHRDGHAAADGGRHGRAPGGPAARWLRRAFVPAGALLVAIALFVVPMPVYAERPGRSLDLTECVVVNDPLAGPVSGDLLLTFATYRRATVADLVASVAADDVLLRPVEGVVPDDVEPAEYFARERLVFDASGRTAAAVGLDRAGYPEPARILGDGARVVRALEGFPAEGALSPGDIVVGANGEPIRTDDELRDVILDGGPLQLTVHRRGDVDEVTVTPELREIQGEQRLVIGAELQTVNPVVELPVDIDVRAGRIGGPSAGLMIALQVYDAVAEEDLAAGRRIAGTGTIDAGGNVGRIGALPLKTAAAVRQGASIFLVPDSQAGDARAAVPAGSRIEVVGVETIDDAITALRELPAGEEAPREARFRPCAERVVDVG